MIVLFEIYCCCREYVKYNSFTITQPSSPLPVLYHAIHSCSCPDSVSTFVGAGSRLHKGLEGLARRSLHRAVIVVVVMCLCQIVFVNSREPG